MRRDRVFLGLVVAVFFLYPAITQGQSAQEAFEQGKTLLAKADFQGALRAYATAARADRQNREYLQQYALVRQIINYRKRLDVERDDQRWEDLARALHSFYVAERIYPEALVLDEKMHARLNTGSTAEMLAETQLAMHRNAEAAKVLAALGLDKATPATQALLGIALARQGKLDKARQIAEKLNIPKNAGPGMLYGAARLYAAVGSRDTAFRLLERCFQSVAPSRLDGFKDHAKQSPAFAGLVATEGFAQVLKTKSKVAESKCSGGSKCAGCPMRGKCAKSQ